MKGCSAALLEPLHFLHSKITGWMQIAWGCGGGGGTGVFLSVPPQPLCRTSVLLAGSDATKHLKHRKYLKKRLYSCMVKKGRKHSQRLCQAGAQGFIYKGKSSRIALLHPSTCLGHAFSVLRKQYCCVQGCI